MQEHEKWYIAHEVLRAAKGLVPLELFAAATYHCQQAAEKALKAYLVYKKQPTIKTHDLIKLVELCMKFDGDFAKKNDAELAIKHAQNIVNFVLKKIQVPDSEQGILF